MRHTETIHNVCLEELQSDETAGLVTVDSDLLGIDKINGVDSAEIGKNFHSFIADGKKELEKETVGKKVDEK